MQVLLWPAIARGCAGVFVHRGTCEGSFQWYGINGARCSSITCWWACRGERTEPQVAGFIVPLPCPVSCIVLLTCLPATSLVHCSLHLSLVIPREKSLGTMSLSLSSTCPLHSTLYRRLPDRFWGIFGGDQILGSWWTGSRRRDGWTMWCKINPWMTELMVLGLETEAVGEWRGLPGQGNGIVVR